MRMPAIVKKGALRSVAFDKQDGIWLKVRSLGIVRTGFVACFFLIFGLLVFWPAVGSIDPHEKFRIEQTVIEEDSVFSLLKTSPRKSGFLVYASPSKEHLLGTDERGRDVLMRLAYGARTTLITGVICVVSFLLAGIGFGVAAGYFEGKWRSLVLYFFNIVNTFPILLLLLLAVIIIDGLIDSQWLFMRIYVLRARLGLFSSPKLAELIKGKIASLKETAFVHAAESLGLSPAQIIFKHILWYECRPLIIVQSAYIMGQAIIVETTLTYLNFGLEFPLMSWGLMLRTMAPGIFSGQIQVIIVMGMIALSVFFFQYLAALLNDLLSTRQREV